MGKLFSPIYAVTTVPNVQRYTQDCGLSWWHPQAVIVNARSSAGESAREGETEGGEEKRGEERRGRMRAESLMDCLSADARMCDRVVSSSKSRLD